MIINGIIGAGTFNTGPGVPNSVISSTGDTLLGFNNFEILARCKLMKDSNYLLSELDIKDVASIDNVRIVDKSFEGVDFLDSRYTEKNITVKVWMKPSQGRSITTLVNEVKDALHGISGTLKYWNRGEIMSLNARVASLKFDIQSSFKSYTVSFITEPYFDSNTNTTTAAVVSTGTSDTISIGNTGHRVQPSLTIVPTGNSGSVTVGTSTINGPIASADVIVYDYATNKALVNGVSAVVGGTQGYLGQNASIPITFNDTDITYPAFDESLSSLTTLVGTSGISLSTNNFGQTFPTNSITNLKKISVSGSNVSSYSISAALTLYTDDTKVTTIASYTQIVYAGQDITSIDYEIDGNGLDISAYASFYAEVVITNISTVPNTATFIFLPDNGSTGTGVGYYNGVAQAFQYKFDLEGISTAYTGTTENVTDFTTTATYTNKYV